MAALLAAAMFSRGALYAQSVNQFAQTVDFTQIKALPNHRPQWANPANDTGTMPPQQVLPPLTIVLSRSPQQESAFERLLADQQNTASPDYHRWLTPAEVGERFGLSQQDIAGVTGWLQSQGLHVNWISPSRIFIGFSGSAAKVGRAFQTELHGYKVNGVQRFSVSSDPMIPIALAPMFKAIRGLYTINEQPLHHLTSLNSTSPELTTGGGHYVTPADFATIYDLPTGLHGYGETIGIVGESRTDFADFSNFDTLTGAGVPNPTEIVPTAYGGVDPGPAYAAPPAAGVSTGAQGEATLDVTRAGSVASAANLLLVIATSASGGIGADAQYLVQTSPVPAQAMTISFGGCESEAGASGVDFWDTLFQQAAAEGISVFVASGDSGASGCDSYNAAPPASPSPNSPNYICSSSYATCVGGTEFNDAGDPSLYWNSLNGEGYSSAIGYIPEGGWNEPLNASSEPQAASSGGGVSAFIPTPAWQTGTGVPTARSGRYTPDIAFSAAGHDGYFACFAAGSGSCVSGPNGLPFEFFYGTSAASPDMAGIAALLDQNLGAAQGNLNPGIYATAAVFPTAFHDVTVGTSGVGSCDLSTPSMCNNSIPSPTTLTGGQAGYLVTSGYDEVTGLGSLDANTFIYNFTTSLAKITPTVYLSGTFYITTAQELDVLVSVAAGPNQPTPTGTAILTTGSYTSAPISLIGTAVYITLPAGTLAVGEHTIAVAYTPDSTSSSTYTAASSTATITVVVPPKIAPALTVTPSASIITNSETLTVAIALNGGAGNPTPTGSVTVTCGSYASLATTLAGGAATIIVPAGSLAVGGDTLTAAYTPDSASSSTYTTSSNFAPITNAGARISPSVMPMPSESSITTVQALTVTITVSGGTGNPTPTGSVTLTSGSYASAVTMLGIGGATIDIPARTLPTGTDTLTCAYTPDAASSSMYQSDSGSNSVLVVAAPPPSFTVSGSSVSIAPGATIATTSIVAVTPSGGFTGSVGLTATLTSSPAGALDLPTFSFGTTSPVNISGTTASIATLTINTTAATTGAVAYPKQRGVPWYAPGGAALGWILLFGIPARRRIWRTMFGVLFLFVAIVGGVFACGGGGGGGGGGTNNPGTTPGAYAITVTGSSGTTVETATVGLTVQ